MNDNNYLIKFWAKTSHDKEKPNAFHPLICHLIDVAAVTQKIWQDVLPSATKTRINKVFGVEDTKNLVAFIAGLHDLGKCSPPFTLRYTKQNVRQILNETEFCYDNYFKNYGEPTPKDAPHGYVTAIELPKILQGDEFRLSSNLARQISILIGGHHGVFPDSSWDGKLSGKKYHGGNRWAEARKLLTLELAEVLQILPLQIPETAKLDNATTMILAGLVSVADWIGSNAEYFPCEADTQKDLPPVDFTKKYFNKAQENAEKALHELGWLNWQKPKGKLTFGEMFSDIEKPRDLQIQAEEISNKFDSAGIAIVESPMGEGKTEAAIYLADTFNFNLEQNGIYFALPTQATSNQMFGRVKEFLEKRYPNKKGEVSMQLLHGHANLSADFATVLKKGAKILKQQHIYNDEEHAHDDCTPAVIASSWFVGGKKGLLAPFGVGTIDQALLAVLQTKHVFVRLFGLAHKTVIIDEVHAYDAYMSTLLERLLMWLAALGSPVVLLSATLPKERRDNLLKSYLKGLNVENAEAKVKELGQNPENKYPRLSYATATEVSVKHLRTSDENSRTLHIENLNGFLTEDENKIRELGAKLKEALSAGGCAAIICNTVRRAQTVYSVLKDYFKDDERFSGKDVTDGKEVLDLLHARFLFKDRTAREKRALIRFGKAGSKVTLSEGGEEKLREESVKRPKRAILISTQIIEQSLDLDFDLMISDLAPADLILQRAGRLMRHKRDKRPTSFSEDNPTIWILQPETDEKGLLISDENNFPKFGTSGIIYDKHILLRSWLELHKRQTIEIPREIEDLIEQVYDTNVSCLHNEVTDFWDNTKKEMVSKLEKKENKAKPNRILPPNWDCEDFLEEFIRKTPLEEDKPEVHKSLQAQTRDDEQPSVSVIFLTEEESHKDKIKTKTDLEMVKFLLNRSVTIAKRGAVEAILTTKPPSAWKESALLRNTFLIELCTDKTKEINNFKFTLDEDLGVLVEKI